VFGISPTELVIILALALLLLGPDQLPAVAKTLGKTLREVRSATDELKTSFDRQLAILERETLPRETSFVAGPAEPQAAALPSPDSGRAEEPAP
jgi:sec-independent protein translocase protein TatB